jgi:NADPH2:quinone reductase
VRHGSPEVAFLLRESADPTPGEGQVRIRVEASGINFADILARQGAYLEAPKPPCVLGFEVVGRIDATGQGVDPGLLGRRVVAFTRFGGYASSVCVPAGSVVPIAEDLDARVAAALATQGVTAYLAAEWLAPIAPGDHVLVQAAAGGVGAMLVQFALRRGAVVSGTAGSDAKLERLRQLGVTHAINYRTHDFARELLRLSHGRRPDVIFDSIGGASARKGRSLLAAGGRIVLHGVAGLSGSGWTLPRAIRLFLGSSWIHPLTLMVESKGVIGLNLLRIADERVEVLTRAMRETVALQARGELAPLVDRAYPVAQAAEAHARVESRMSMGKVVLLWP